MIPRNEHPNPQFERKDWICLNGEWEFEIDKSVSGMERKLYEKEHLDLRILVPFCPESSISGVGDKDFLNCVWYRRDIEIPENMKGKRVILHFDAVDHEATVYVNGKQAGTHIGGFVGFSVDITDHLEDGKGSVCLCAVDDVRDPRFGSGKQCDKYASRGCHYTRTTGIWQSVWLEFVNDVRINSFRLYPDVNRKKLDFTADLCGWGELKAVAYYNGKEVGSTKLEFCQSGSVSGSIALSELHLWEIGNGRLYDLVFTYGEDEVKTYFGMRSITYDGMKFYLNGKSVFQRLVLDQGFYPDGIYTARDDAALINDIVISMDAGFNGARLHQKVFEPRFLYHCDRLGYLVWGEYGNWGINYSRTDALPYFLDEWAEILERDFNHPAIVGWCPWNEFWDNGHYIKDTRLTATTYKMTKAIDTTRPCIDTSGGVHTPANDIYDVHDYTQKPEEFSFRYSAATITECMEKLYSQKPHYADRNGYFKEGQPFFMSEYGGIKWDVNSGNANAWGYGEAPTTEEEFIERYRGLTNVLLDNPSFFAFCYTQLYDVEQEVNGLYTYDRKPKFDMSVFKEINSRKAAVED